MSKEVDCIDDALLADVVAKAKVARQAIRGAYHDPEEAWIDAYLEGWFEGHFRTSQETTQEEVNVVLDRSF